MDRRRLQVPLVAMAAAASVGAADSWRAGRPATAGILVVAAVVAAAAAWSLRRYLVLRLRGDVAAWLEASSAVTGEPAGALVQRALVAYRAEVGDDATA